METITEQDAIELELIKSAQNGHPDSFGVLCEVYRSRAVNIAKQYMRNLEEAEDVAQDSFLKAFKALTDFDTASPFYPWLYKIIKNTSLNKIKSKQRKTTDSMDAMEENVFAQFECDAADPRENAFSAETSQNLWTAMEQIKPEFREIIIMKHFHYLSYKEIAEALNIPVGTVMSRLFNARAELRSEMKELGE